MMEEHKVFISNRLQKRLSDYDYVTKIGKKLKNNPYQGDSVYKRFLREKRFEGRRVYWLVYKDFLMVLIVAESGKKDQQDTIEGIKKLLPIFMKEAEKIYKNF